jgi:monovalent cation:proton antiporter-2 (CPA2) family protein
MSFLAEAAVLLIAAVVIVPLFKRAKLGAILGYLAAGVIVGPSVFALVHDVETILHFSELGVVFFLFLVGLELEPNRLWQLRRAVFGLGNLQLLATTVVLVPIIMFGLSLPFAAAVVAGLGFALSSTAIALQLLAERMQVATQSGRAAFSVLLFQDLAVVPILALIPLLAGQDLGTLSETAIAVVKVMGMTALVIVGGRFLTRPVFRVIAQSKVHEISTAVALLIVVGAGLLMSLVGMSMALGAFLAGVLLADSEYRHELEASIEPFKGLLLGLFFMAIGMSLNLSLLIERPVSIVAATVVVMLVKSAVLLGVIRIVDPEKKNRVLVSPALSQAGEFAFVLFGIAASAAVLDAKSAQLLTVVVSLSMALTPILMIAVDRYAARAFAHHENREFDKLDDVANPVIIAGFGRYGQIISRILTVNNIGFTALEVNATHVDFVRKFGNKLFYGDASRLELLRAAKTEDARLFVLAIDDPEASIRTATVVKKAFPHLPIYARARNRAHAFRLLDLGVHVMNRETFLSAIDMAKDVLVGLGMPSDTAAVQVERFRVFDEEVIRRQHLVHHDEAKLIQSALEASEELKTLFEQDREAVTKPT